MSLIENIKKQVEKSQTKKTSIVFAEGWNPVIQEAAVNLRKEGIIEPILVFRTIEEETKNPLVKDISRVVIEKTDLSQYAQYLYGLRKEKGLSLEEANKLIKEPNYLVSVIVKLGHADGAICGIEYTTKDTLRPALQIIKTAKSSEIVSSVLILEKGDETLFLSDVSLVIDPSSLELAQLTENIIDFVQNKLDVQDTRTALLSYSTNGSGAGPSVEKVKEGYKLFKERNKFPDAKVFGEIQFDAAYVDSIRNKKAPNLGWDKGANVYVFPHIDAGNITYKVFQRCGGYEVTGPIIVGLAKPVNDLSRGAGLYEVVSLSYITALQAIKN